MPLRNIGMNGGRLHRFGTLPTKVVNWGKGLRGERWGTVASSLRRNAAFAERNVAKRTPVGWTADVGSKAAFQSPPAAASASHSDDDDEEDDDEEDDDED